MKTLLKFLLLFLILQVSDEQSEINIEILGGEKSLGCAQDIGRTEFKAQYSFSEQQTLNSYFILYFKGASNKKYCSICSLASSKPEQNSTEPQSGGDDPSQGGDEPNQGENDPDKINSEIIEFLEKQENKFKERIENVASNPAMKNFLEIVSNLARYHTINFIEKVRVFSKEKLSQNINTGLNALSKIGNLTQNLKDLNLTEAKNKFNASLCDFKQKIIENIRKSPELLQKYNISKILEDISNILPEINITKEYEKIVDNYNKSLTEFNSYLIQSLEKVVNAFGPNQNISGIINTIKAKIESEKEKIKSQIPNITSLLPNIMNMNKTYLDNLKVKINQTIYNLPSYLEEESKKNRTLVLFDKLVDFLNYSNPKNTIQKIVTDMKYNTEMFINITNFAKVFSKRFDELKEKIIDLNIPIINVLFEGFENLTSLFTERFGQGLNLSTIKIFIQNRTTEIKSIIDTQKKYFNGLLNTTRISQLIEAINKTNVDQVKEILKDSLNLIRNFIENGTVLPASITNEIKNTVANIIRNNTQLQNLIFNLKLNNEKIKSIMNSSNFVNLLSEDIKKSTEAINNSISILKETLNERLKTLYDKISNANYSEVKEHLIEIKEKYSTELSQLKQAINSTDLSFDSIVPIIRKIIEKNLSSMNWTKFNNSYQNFLSKVKEEYTNLITLIKEKNFTLPASLTKIKDAIDNIKEQIRANSTAMLKSSIETSVHYIKTRIDSINSTILSKIFTNIENKLKSSTLYPKIEPYLKTIDSAIRNINEAQIVEVIQYLLLNRTDIRNNIRNDIKNKIGQINLTDSLVKLNVSLDKIKDAIINEMKNTTKITNELKIKIKERIEKIKNSFNISLIREKINSTLANISLIHPIYEKLVNFNYSKYIPAFNYSKYLPNLNYSKYLSILDNINIEEITNITRIKEIASNIVNNMKNNSQKFQEKLKESFIKINESLYTCENSFIGDIQFDFSSVEKALSDAKNKLKDATIGDVLNITKEFVSQLVKNLTSKINFNFSIFQNEHVNTLIEEINSPLTKLKTKIESNEYIQTLLTRFDNVETLLKNLINNANSFSFLQTIKNEIIISKQSLANIKLSSIKEFTDKIKEIIDKDKTELEKYEKISEKIRYLINEYFIENEVVQNIVDKRINKTLINEAINKVISFIEKSEDYYKEMLSENGTKIRDESKEAIKDIINDALNMTDDDIIKLNETVSNDIDDLIEFVDLLKKKYESIKNSESRSNKKRIEEISLQILINNTKLIEFLENVRGLLEKIGFNINSLGITSETFDKIEEGLGTLQSMLIKVPNALIGSNYTRIINVIKEKINTKIKDQIKKQIIQAIDSNFMNYFINLESITKILTLFKYNKEVANVFINQIMKLSEYITNIRSKLQNGNFDISELLQKIREDYLSSNKNDIYTIIKGILDSKTNSTLLSDFSLKLLNFIQQFFEYIKNLPNAFKTFGINRLRLLSIDYNNRRTEETGSLTCKFDETISEDLTASPEDISSLILKTGQNYTLNIQSGINIKADKDKTDKCTNNNENIKKQVTFNNLSGLGVEGSKKRFKFSIRIKISRTWRRPSFFYLFMKLRMKLKSKGNLRNLDVEEDTGSYCLIDDESNSDNVQLSCYGNNDNIDENTEKITLSNFTSDYIELPENLSVANSTKGNEPSSNNNNGNRYFMRSNSSGLSGGAIAGIVIACVAVLAIVISLMLYFRKKSNVPNPNQTTNEVTDSVNHLKISDKI